MHNRNLQAQSDRRTIDFRCFGARPRTVVAGALLAAWISGGWTGGRSVLAQQHPIAGHPIAGQPLRASQPFVMQLTDSHTGSVDGRSFRQAIRIAAAAQGETTKSINVWLDRKVDPDCAVFPGPLGPTRYASFCQIAQAAECVCFPLDNCVLIGRSAWVAAVLEGIFSPANDAASGGERVHRKTSPVDVQWPPLTTPNEALEHLQRQLAGQSLGYGDLPTLPHDLWPAVEMYDISPHLMYRLIVGQFLPLQPSEAPIRRFYKFPRQREAFASINGVDPQAKLGADGGLQIVTATAAAHVWLCQQLLSAADSDDQRAAVAVRGSTLIDRLRSDGRTFSMTVENEPAERVIKTLAAGMKVRVRFDAAANRRVQQRVTFQAEDKTLWELLRLITDRASLKIDAAEGSLRISAEEES